MLCKSSLWMISMSPPEHQKPDIPPKRTVCDPLDPQKLHVIRPKTVRHARCSAGRKEAHLFPFRIRKDRRKKIRSCAWGAASEALAPPCHQPRVATQRAAKNPDQTTSISLLKRRQKSTTGLCLVHASATLPPPEVRISDERSSAGNEQWLILTS